MDTLLLQVAIFPSINPSVTHLQRLAEPADNLRAVRQVRRRGHADKRRREETDKSSRCHPTITAAALQVRLLRSLSCF